MIVKTNISDYTLAAILLILISKNRSRSKSLFEIIECLVIRGIKIPRNVFWINWIRGIAIFK